MTAPAPPEKPAAGRVSRRLWLSFRAKLTAALLVTGGLPLLLLALASNVLLRQGLETAERATQAAILDGAAHSVRDALEDAAEATHRVGFLLSESRIADGEARLAMAGETIAVAEALAGVAIYRPDGVLIDAIYRQDCPPALRGQLPAKLPAAVVAASGGIWLVPSGSGTDVLLHYAEPVVRDGQRRAIVMAILATANMRPRLLQIEHDNFGEQSDGLLLLDETARIFVGTAGGPLSPGRSLAGRDLLSSVALPTAGIQLPMSLTMEFTDPQGQEMLGTVRSLPEYHLLLLVRRPLRSAYGVLRSVRWLLIGSALLFAVVALGIGQLLSVRTTRPLRELMRLTRAYAQRDFRARPTIRSGDELEELGGSLSDMAQELAASEKEIARRAQVEAGLSRFLPAEVARSIASGERSLALGGERRRISVLFADVVSFTSFAEKAAPEQVVGFLNELFGLLSEVVFRHGGIVDKFIGDSIMAVFGAPQEQADHVQRALAAAEDIQRFVAAQAPAWQAEYGIEVHIGIGVNCGEALVGNLGSEQRMEYTAIGDVVNIAARLEALARPGQTLVTSEIAQAAGTDWSFNSLGEQPLRGKRQAVHILELA